MLSVKPLCCCKTAPVLTQIDYAYSNQFSICRTTESLWRWVKNRLNAFIKAGTITYIVLVEKFDTVVSKKPKSSQTMVTMEKKQTLTWWSFLHIVCTSSNNGNGQGRSHYLFVYLFIYYLFISFYLEFRAEQIAKCSTSISRDFKKR